jgi:hypothetical protein
MSVNAELPAFRNSSMIKCTCMYYLTNSVFIPLMSHILVKLLQIKYENDKYGIGKILINLKIY